MSLPVVSLGPASAYALYDLVETHILTAYPDVTVRHTKTQTAFARKVQFAWVTPPLRKTDAGGIMIYIALPFPLDSPRIVRVSCPAHDRFMHQFVLRTPDDFDAKLQEWISLSWALVGPGKQRRTAPNPPLR